jgi:hypothetical protein
MVMDPVAAVLQPGDPFLPVTDQPGVHALAANPIPFGDLGHWNTGADFQHSAVSLLGHAQLPQHERECQASSEAKVSSIKRDSTLRFNLVDENFLYVFKAAPLRWVLGEAAQTAKRSPKFAPAFQRIA